MDGSVKPFFRRPGFRGTSRGYLPGMEPLPQVLAHVGHWLFEAIMFAPAIALVVLVSIRSILQRRNDPPLKENA